jgi:hypothetical protein
MAGISGIWPVLQDDAGARTPPRQPAGRRRYDQNRSGLGCSPSSVSAVASQTRGAGKLSGSMFSTAHKGGSFRSYSTHFCPFQ